MLPSNKSGLPDAGGSKLLHAPATIYVPRFCTIQDVKLAPYVQQAEDPLYRETDLVDIQLDMGPQVGDAL